MRDSSRGARVRCSEISPLEITAAGPCGQAAPSLWQEAGRRTPAELLLFFLVKLKLQWCLCVCKKRILDWSVYSHSLCSLLDLLMHVLGFLKAF